MVSSPSSYKQHSLPTCNDDPSSSSSSSSFALIHHTNHQGYFILPEAAGPHFPLPVIWTQAVWRSKTTNEEPAQTQQRDDDSAAIEQTTQHNSTYNHNHNNKQQQQQQQQQQLLVGCCPHVGRRSIRIVNSDFPSCHDDDEWFLFCVQVVSNSSNNSIYYKFAVSPSENNNNNINNNSNTISNTILATTGGVSLRPECLLEDLEYYLTLFREQHIAGHIHVGLVIDTLRAPLTSLSSICDYRAACLQDLVACEDEAILDMWLQRAQQQQQQTKTKIEKQQQQQDSSTAATTIWQPTPFSSDIPKTIVVAEESSFYKNLRGV